jgi:hypothetical protein
VSKKSASVFVRSRYTMVRYKALAGDWEPIGGGFRSSRPTSLSSWLLLQQFRAAGGKAGALAREVQSDRSPGRSRLTTVEIASFIFKIC